MTYPSKAKVIDKKFNIVDINIEKYIIIYKFEDSQKVQSQTVSHSTYKNTPIGKVWWAFEQIEKA
jgi:hypothetical protein